MLLWNNLYVWLRGIFCCSKVIKNIWKEKILRTLIKWDFLTNQLNNRNSTWSVTERLPFGISFDCYNLLSEDPSNSGFQEKVFGCTVSKGIVRFDAEQILMFLFGDAKVFKRRQGLHRAIPSHTTWAGSVQWFWLSNVLSTTSNSKAIFTAAVEVFVLDSRVFCFISKHCIPSKNWSMDRYFRILSVDQGYLSKNDQATSVSNYWRNSFDLSIRNQFPLHLF